MKQIFRKRFTKLCVALASVPWKTSLSTGHTRPGRRWKQARRLACLFCHSINRMMVPCARARHLRAGLAWMRMGTFWALRNRLCRSHEWGVSCAASALCSSVCVYVSLCVHMCVCDLLHIVCCVYTSTLSGKCPILQLDSEWTIKNQISQRILLEKWRKTYSICGKIL